jgi:hypothetical protein
MTNTGNRRLSVSVTTKGDQMVRSNIKLDSLSISIFWCAIVKVWIRIWMYCMLRCRQTKPKANHAAPCQIGLQTHAPRTSSALHLTTPHPYHHTPLHSKQ